MWVVFLPSFLFNILLSASITSRCSGGKVERKRQKVLTGLLRDSITVGSALECIERYANEREKRRKKLFRCIDVNVNLPFKCMSIAYYYEVRFLLHLLIILILFLGSNLQLCSQRWISSLPSRFSL